MPLIRWQYWTHGGEQGIGDSSCSKRREQLQTTKDICTHPLLYVVLMKTCLHTEERARRAVLTEPARRRRMREPEETDVERAVGASPLYFTEHERRQQVHITITRPVQDWTWWGCDRSNNRRLIQTLATVTECALLSQGTAHRTLLLTGKVGFCGALSTLRYINLLQTSWLSLGPGYIKRWRT